MGKRKKPGRPCRSPVYLTSFDRVAGASDGPEAGSAADRAESRYYCISIQYVKKNGTDGCLVFYKCIFADLPSGWTWGHSEPNWKYWVSGGILFILVCCFIYDGIKNRDKPWWRNRGPMGPIRPSAVERVDGGLTRF